MSISLLYHSMHHNIYQVAGETNILLDGNETPMVYATEFSSIKKQSIHKSSINKIWMLRWTCANTTWNTSRNECSLLKAEMVPTE